MWVLSRSSHCSNDCQVREVKQWVLHFDYFPPHGFLVLTWCSRYLLSSPGLDFTLVQLECMWNFLQKIFPRKMSVEVPFNFLILFQLAVDSRKHWEKHSIWLSKSSRVSVWRHLIMAASTCYTRQIETNSLSFENVGRSADDTSSSLVTHGFPIWIFLSPAMLPVH